MLRGIHTGSWPAGSGGRPEHAGQRGLEALLFCGFSKNRWHFPGRQPPPRLRAHVTSHPTPKGFTSGAK